MSQRDRLREPYPWTWEPFAIVLTLLGVAVEAAIQFGRAVANSVAGRAWQVPPLTAWAATAPGILAGNAQAGLDPAAGPSAGPGLLGSCIAIVGALLATLMACVLVWAQRRWGTGRVRGVATPSEVSRSLGFGRLRRSQAQIRPDLHEQGD